MSQDTVKKSSGRQPPKRDPVKLALDLMWMGTAMYLFLFGTVISEKPIFLIVIWPAFVAQLYYWVYAFALCGLEASRKIAAAQGVHDLVSTVALNWVAAGVLLLCLTPLFDINHDYNWRLMLKWFVLSTAVQEVGMYVGHRLLHTKLGYPLHAKHHKLRSLVPVGATYCSVFEHISINLMPLLLGPLICHSSIEFIYPWIIIGLRKTVYDHSNYSYADMGEMKHSLHHQLYKVNYATTGVLDKLCNTFTE